jgi:hypothetical protein
LDYLKTMETRPEPEQRKVWKFTLIRGLYERGLDRQDILNLYRFIDWLMQLPKGLENTLWNELKLETLSEALLDFSQPSDLDDWLRLHG